MTTALRDFLVELGAAARPHGRGTLLAHLERTAGILRRWGARDAVVTAGLFHSVYGTPAYPEALVPFSKRAPLRTRLGSESEALVWLFSRLERRSLFGSSPAPSVILRSIDGGSAEAVQVEEAVHSDLVWLTWANLRDHFPLRATPTAFLDRCRGELAASEGLLPGAIVGELREVLR